ncbi:MAG: hypothetical protein JWN76_1739 [Chitinophagaceae bacterium]|nr:hypothetical protein [Chitinophagaceae bacterium]
MRTVLFLFFLCITPLVYSQVHFKIFNPEQAKQDAAKQHKLILLQVRSSACDDCNSIADKSFSSPELNAYLNEYCIPYVLEQNDPESAAIKEEYNIGDGNYTLFLNADGDIIHRYNGSSSLYTAYVTEIKTAVQKAKTFSGNLKLSGDEYNKDPKSFSKLYAFISAREMAGLKNDSLVNELVSLAPDDSLKSYSFIRFAIRQSPELRSVTTTRLRTNPDIFKEAWYQLLPAERVRITNNTYNNSMRQAIRKKDMGYAMTIANSISAGSAKPAARSRAYTWQMMKYYEGTHDTLSYLVQAVKYYDSYTAEFQPDSIKRQDSLNLQQLMKNAGPGTPQVLDAKVPVLTRRITYSPVTQRYSSTLNNGAFKIYKWSKTELYRQKALEYVKRALEFYVTPQALDTYARLLYVTGNKEEAVNTMRKAIALLGDHGFSATDYRKTMDKMKNNEQID